MYSLIVVELIPVQVNLLMSLSPTASLDVHQAYLSVTNALITEELIPL